MLSFCFIHTSSRQARKKPADKDHKNKWRCLSDAAKGGPAMHAMLALTQHARI
jgi:hypothetical protein